MPQHQSKSDLLIQIVGEILLYIPLFVVSYFLNTLLYTMFSMISFSIIRQLFPTVMHFKTSTCLMISYTLFLIIPIFYLGFSVLFTEFKNQPALLLLIVIAVVALFAEIGSMAEKIERAKAQEDLENESTFLEFLNRHKIKEKYHKYLFEVLIRKRRDVDVIYSEDFKGLLLDEHQCRNVKSKVRKLMEEPKST